MGPLDTQILDNLLKRYPGLLDPSVKVMDAAVISDLMFYLRYRREFGGRARDRNGIRRLNNIKKAKGGFGPPSFFSAIHRMYMCFQTRQDIVQLPANVRDFQSLIII